MSEENTKQEAAPEVTPPAVEENQTPPAESAGDGAGAGSGAEAGQAAEGATAGETNA